MNHTRAAHGLRPLRVDAALVRAARSHSAEMLRGNSFAHGDFHGRMVAFHVRGPVAGENLAWGNGQYARPATIVREWLASPEHRANLLHAGWMRIGIGISSSNVPRERRRSHRDRRLRGLVRACEGAPAPTGVVGSSAKGASRRPLRYSESISERNSASFSPRSSSRSPFSIRSSSCRTSGASSSGLNGFVT